MYDNITPGTRGGLSPPRNFRFDVENRCGKDPRKGDKTSSGIAVPARVVLPDAVPIRRGNNLKRNRRLERVVL